MRALEAALNVVWAMEERSLETLLEIAAREHDVTPEALEAYRAKSLAQAEQATVRDGVAIISANGPLFKRANLMTALSGATSYDIMRRDLQAAVDDGKLRGAILNLDSPGGEASGANELAAYVASLRGKFPVIAYVNGMAASAAYWIAAAAQEIVVDSTAILGSIGVQMAMRKREDAKGTTTYTFISSQSPLKNADPGTEEGAKQIQSAVDAMAQVFVESVAAYRGVATETALTDFGQGGILVGQDAVKAGLADRIGNFEAVLAELSSARRPTKTTKGKGATMADETTYTAEERDNAVSAALKAEKARVAGLRKIAAGFGTDDAALNAAIEGDTSVEAFSLAEAEKAATKRAAEAAAAADAAEEPEAKKAAALAALKKDEDAAAAAAASTGKEPEQTDEQKAEALAKSIIEA
jgi:signal peptide peptidase SppA